MIFMVMKAPSFWALHGDLIKKHDDLTCKVGDLTGKVRMINGDLTNKNNKHGE